MHAVTHMHDCNLCYTAISNTWRRWYPHMYMYMHTYTQEYTLWICPGLRTYVRIQLLNSISPNTADVPHVTISVTMFPMSSLMLVGTVLNLVMFTVVAFSGSRWVRGKDRVANPFDNSVILDWNSSAVMSATCTPSMSIVYRSVG